MANAADKNELIKENLIDIGLDNNEISQCIRLLENGRSSALERVLAEYRKQLLDSLHQYERRIDCLDYFTYKLKTEVSQYEK